MKRISNYVLGLAVILTVLQSCSNGDIGDRKFIDIDKQSNRYFFESKDSVLGSLSLSPSSSNSYDVKIYFDGNHNLKPGNPEIRFETVYGVIKNDSLFKKTEHLNKYNESVPDPLVFIATFNNKGILNTIQLMDFVNNNSMVTCLTTDDVPKIDKVTVRPI